MTKRELMYLHRLKHRCDVLRARVAADTSEKIRTEWLQELHAIEWAVSRLSGDQE